jgi:peroxiredoxin
MIKMRKVLLVVTILALTLAAGCAKSPPKEGITTPDFQLKNLDGKSITLSALRGQPVLLNFWATWCGPCRSEMPYIQQLSGDPTWKARGLVILAVNLQESEATVRKFMADNAFSFTVLLDTTGDTSRLYNISAIPTTYIIDKDGIIKSDHVGAFSSKAQIDQILKDALGEK